MKANEYPQDDKSPQNDKKQPSNRSQVIPFLVVVAILILLISLLGPPPGKGDLQLIDGAEDGFECVYYVDGKQSETPVRRVISNNVSPYYVDGQVIVTGPIKAINDVRAVLEDKQILLEPLELCDVRYMGIKTERAAAEIAPTATIAPEAAPPITASRDETGIPQAPASFRVPRTQAFVLFQVVDGNVPNAVQAINEAGFTRGVYADPNYLTGPLAGSPCGSPFEVGGSPFEVGGSPFEVGGSPAGAALAQAETKIFWKQQTFTETHILPANQLLRNDIRVAVFDTIPKEGECDCDCDCNQPSDHIVNIDNQSDTNQDGQMDKQEFQIHIFPTSQTNDLQPVDPNSVDVSEHGVFIAGLINAVSGVEEIDLYEVLNSAGCGDLHVLNQALNNYSSTIQSQNGGSMKNVVINLSLGVHQPENPKDEGLPEKVFTLSEILSDAHQKGAVIVAAAGNNSAELDEPRPSDVPASYDYVIGVAASNNEDPPKRQRACYSNHGNIAAPAGDGGPFELLPPEIQEAIREANIPPDSNGLKYEDRKCLPLSIICRPDKADCEYGLASYSPGSITRYRFWAGTSFAAPLVSGIAVLTLDLGHKPEDVKNVIYGWVASPLAAPAWEPGIIRPIDTLPTPTPAP